MMMEREEERRGGDAEEGRGGSSEEERKKLFKSEARGSSQSVMFEFDGWRTMTTRFGDVARRDERGRGVAVPRREHGGDRLPAQRRSRGGRPRGGRARAGDRRGVARRRAGGCLCSWQPLPVADRPFRRSLPGVPGPGPAARVRTALRIVCGAIWLPFWLGGSRRSFAYWEMTLGTSSLPLKR